MKKELLEKYPEPIAIYSGYGIFEAIKVHAIVHGIDDKVLFTDTKGKVYLRKVYYGAEGTYFHGLQGELVSSSELLRVA